MVAFEQNLSCTN